MTTSGTYNFLPSTGELGLTAFARIGVRRTELTTTHLPSPLSDYGDCIVYAAINSVNGKLYIGATEKGLQQRMWRHFSRARRGENGYFAAAIRKYGQESIYFFAIEECRDFWHALERERYFISALNPEYNLTRGGGGVKGLKFSAESRAKMSAAKKGKKQYKFTKDDIAKSIAARAATRGQKITDPQRLAKIREFAAIANMARKRKVICSNGIIFNSVVLAAAHYNKTTGQVSRSCKYGKRFRCGLIFRYLGDSE